MLLHAQFINNMEEGRYFVDKLLPYINEQQRYVLTQRLIHIDISTCVEANSFLRRKTFLLFMLTAQANDKKFAQDYLPFFLKNKNDEDFF